MGYDYEQTRREQAALHEWRRVHEETQNQIRKAADQRERTAQEEEKARNVRKAEIAEAAARAATAAAAAAALANQQRLKRQTPPEPVTPPTPLTPEQIARVQAARAAAAAQAERDRIATQEAIDTMFAFIGKGIALTFMAARAVVLLPFAIALFPVHWLNEKLVDLALDRKNPPRDLRNHMAKRRGLRAAIQLVEAGTVAIGLGAIFFSAATQSSRSIPAKTAISASVSTVAPTQPKRALPLGAYFNVTRAMHMTTSMNGELIAFVEAGSCVVLGNIVSDNGRTYQQVTGLSTDNTMYTGYVHATGYDLEPRAKDNTRPCTAKFTY